MELEKCWNSNVRDIVLPTKGQELNGNKGTPMNIWNVRIEVYLYEKLLEWGIGK